MICEVHTDADGEDKVTQRELFGAFKWMFFICTNIYISLYIYHMIQISSHLIYTKSTYIYICPLNVNFLGPHFFEFFPSNQIHFCQGSREQDTDPCAHGPGSQLFLSEWKGCNKKVIQKVDCDL